MYAVVVDVSISDNEPALQMLRERIVPNVSAQPGFVTGVWLSPAEGKGHSVVMFDSEDAARAAAAQVTPPPGAPVTVDSVAVREVAAHA